jgi:predicted RNA-binding Zn-ribbon protein involved in translation (DUF1610 family)
MSGRDQVPAIVRDIDPDKDAPTVTRHKNAGEKIISQPTDTVTFNRGMGDSGYRVQVVEHDCPECGFDRMVRRIDVSPVRPNEVRYWCLNPNCKYFVRDELSYAFNGSYPQRTAETPAIFEEI